MTTIVSEREGGWEGGREGGMEEGEGGREGGSVYKGCGLRV